MNAGNETVIRRWFQEVWNERRDAAIEELSHPECVGHHDGRPPLSIACFREFRSALLERLPDARVEVEEVVSDGDKVAARWRCRGVSPGGAPVEFTGMTWLRVAGGQIVEAWDAFDPAALGGAG